MKQKLGLACALVHTPEVLLLDEPTNGVDPVSRSRDFWKILYDLLREGVTIFVSTAYLDEAERCTRIGLMHKGRILIEDEPKNVRKLSRTADARGVVRGARAAIEPVRRMDGVHSVSLYGDRLHIALKEETAGAVHIARLTQKGIEVKDYREILPSLEDVFISMVEK